MLRQEKVLKDFSDTIVIDGSLKKRADDVLAGLTGTVAKATEIQAIQAAGLLDMTEGLASNAKACKNSFNECSESGMSHTCSCSINLTFSHPSSN